MTLDIRHKVERWNGRLIRVLNLVEAKACFMPFTPFRLVSFCQVSAWFRNLHQSGIESPIWRTLTEVIPSDAEDLCSSTFFQQGHEEKNATSSQIHQVEARKSEKSVDLSIA